MLVLLYYLSQNPDFPESVKPIMGQLKNSQQMLSFLNELSQFTKTFSTLKNTTPNPQPSDQRKENQASSTTPPKSTQTKDERKNIHTEEKKPQSPTQGIADEFIQNILEGYLKKH